MNPHYRHVDFSGILRLYERAQAAGFTEDAHRQFVGEYERELAKIRRRALLRSVPVNGDLALGRRQGYFATVLHDGSLGYFQRRADDCLQASIATLAEMPMHQVPDPHIDRQLASGLEHKEMGRVITQQFIQWSEQHGLTILKHAEPATWAKRWIGVVPGGDLNPFHDHCLIMSGRDCLWDTSRWLPPTKHESITSNENLDALPIPIDAKDGAPSATPTSPNGPMSLMMPAMLISSRW